MNKSAQFTLGPWKVVHDNAIDATYIVPVKPCDSHALARVYRNHPEYEDNAAFIAAAPAMYEALLQVREMLLILADNAGDVPEWNTGGELYELAHTVRIALAQAEGRQA